jgi:hypothetical protein
VVSETTQRQRPPWTGGALFSCAQDASTRESRARGSVTRAVTAAAQMPSLVRVWQGGRNKSPKGSVRSASDPLTFRCPAWYAANGAFSRYSCRIMDGISKTTSKTTTGMSKP